MEGTTQTGRRAETRRAILAAARHHAERSGWRRARVGDIARDAGISRPTLYKEFPSKQDLGDALLLREVGAFLRRLEEGRAAAGPGLHNRIRHAMEGALLEVTRNPLLAGLLAEGRSGEGSLLPALTEGRTDVVDLATTSVAGFLAVDAPEVDPAAVRFAATVCVRLAVSFLVDPPAEPPSVTATRVADLCVGYLGASS